MLFFNKFLKKRKSAEEKLKQEVQPPKSPKSTQLVEQEIEQAVPNILRSEFNFLKYPFFDLTKSSKRDKIEVSEIIERDGGKAEILWKVLRTVEYGFPSAFDKKVHRAVEQIINQLPKPITNPIRLGSLRELCRLMGISPNSGYNKNRIKESFERITLTGIQTKGTFYLKDEKRRIDETFHIYDHVILAGKELSDGTIADAVYLLLGNFYLRNINANYVVPLDFEYYKSLKGTITERLYEYIGLMIYAALENNQHQRYVHIKYSTLCSYLPLARQTVKWKAKQQLAPAHSQLTESGYFRDVDWQDTHKKDDWLIYYYIGERARDEWKRNKESKSIPPEFQLEAPMPQEAKPERQKSKEEPAKQKPKQTQEEETLSPIAQELFNRGITKSVAIDFAESFPEEHLAEKIEMHDEKKEVGEITTNAAGWLREAIVRDYQLSEEQLKKQAQLEKKQAQQEEQRTLEEKAKEIQEQRLLEALKDFPDDEQWVRERVMEHVKVREMTIKVTGSEPFTPKEIKEMYLKFKAEIPKTDEEKRAWLISNYSKYALSDIISELRQEHG